LNAHRRPTLAMRDQPLKITAMRKRMKFRSLSLTSTQQQEFETLAADPPYPAGYRWLDPDKVPTVVPGSLRRKFTSALLMWERTSSGATYVVCNGVRLDPKANALDQEPFGVAVHSSGASTAGIFAHHGSWMSRTVPITSDVQAVLESTSLGNYFPLGEVPSNSSQGPLVDLKNTSHEGAFQSVISRLVSRST
jgi:hypothetical protein